MQTRACCRSYGCSGTYDCRRATTTGTRVHVTADAREPPAFAPAARRKAEGGKNAPSCGIVTASSSADSPTGGGGGGSGLFGGMLHGLFGGKDGNSGGGSPGGTDNGGRGDERAEERGGGGGGGANMLRAPSPAECSAFHTPGGSSGGGSGGGSGWCHRRCSSRRE